MADFNAKLHTGASGGAALGRSRSFLKEPDVFRTDSGPGAKQDYAGNKDALTSRSGTKKLKTVKPRC